MARIFVYADQEFEDPGAEFTNEHVQRALSGTFPEIANAEVVEEEQEDGSLRVEFRKRAGRKGRQ